MLKGAGNSLVQMILDTQKAAQKKLAVEESNPRSAWCMMWAEPALLEEW